jgi:hypothetical protein
MRTAEFQPREQMLRMITGYWVSQLIYVAARLGLADAIGDRARTADEVAARVKARPETVQRVLRALADVRIFGEDSKGRFRVNGLGRMLRSGPGSMRNLALLLMDDSNWQAVGGLFDGVKRGTSPFENVHKVPSYEYLRRHPELERLLSRLQRGTEGENTSIARAFKFDRFRKVVDVGGSSGHLLAAILRRYPTVNGVLFDLPQVAARTRRDPVFRSPRLRGRVEFAGGDFFKGVPAGADAYLVRFVLHNWDDDECVKILRNCRRAMASGGSVLVLEHVLSDPGVTGDFTRIGDIGMLALNGGQERSRRDYARLFARAGLALRRTVSTTSPLGVGTPLSILEAVRAH